jgi:predicted ATPase
MRFSAAKDQAHVTLLALNCLGRGDGAALVRRLLGTQAALPQDVIDEIVDRTDGIQATPGRARVQRNDPHEQTL